MNRLHPAHLDRLAPDVERPRYDRAQLQVGIIHLGVGAFHRAHQAVVNEAALHATGDLRWGTLGVSLRQTDTRDALRPQAGLYAVAQRDAAADGSVRDTLQVIGHLRGVLAAQEYPGAVLESIAHADTRIVSLTLTEKGYLHDPATGALRLDDPDIAHDFAHPAEPRTAVGFIVHALDLRRLRGVAPVTLLSCDNLAANGDLLRGLVLAFAAEVDPALRRWIELHCTFPNSMVDRIVPRTSAIDCERVSARLGLEDAWPVVCEPFLDWVIEDRFANGRPAWEHGGARFVESAEPFVRLKLRMVNGSHSALAWLGLAAGARTVDQALAAPALRRYLDALMRDEIAPTLSTLPGIELTACRERLLQRFANPALQHLLDQIAADSSQKLPQRLLGTIRDLMAAHLSFDRHAVAVAAWIRSLGDATHAISDPLALQLRARWAAASTTRSLHDRVEAVTRFEPVFGELGRQPRFVTEVARHALSLRDRGVTIALDSLT